MTKPPHPHIQRRATGDGASEDLLRQPVGAGEPNEALDSTQRGFLCTALGYRHAVPGDSGEDFVERVVIVELPPERGDVLGGSALQQEPALVLIEPEPHDIGQSLVEMHADGVAAEPPPVGEPVGLDDDVAEVDVSEHDAGRHGANVDFSEGIR